MADRDRLTKDEWDDLEPLLRDADRAVHERFLANAEARAVLGETDRSPGYLLLQHLQASGDQKGVKLLRAAEMYQHEITRADITAAYLRGEEVGRSAGTEEGSD